MVGRLRRLLALQDARQAVSSSHAHTVAETSDGSPRSTGRTGSKEPTVASHAVSRRPGPSPDVPMRQSPELAHRTS